MTGLNALEVPAGTAGLNLLWAALPDALAGGTPLALIPAHAPASVRTCFHLDGPTDDLDGVAVVVATSGSTGTPRGVLCPPHALRANTIGPRYQWVLALPPSAMGGLNVLMRGLAHDLQPIAADGPIHAVLPDLVRNAHSDPLAISLVPTQLAMCLRDPQATAALATFAHVLIGGAHLPPVLADAAREHGIAVATSYGTTETCGGCVIDGRPMPGVQVIIETDGRIRLHGPMVTRGYRCDPSATRAVFDGASFLTNDIGEFVDGILRVSGRSDDIIAITGTNVSTNAVADRILAHPNIVDAAVVVVERSAHTPELAAFCVGEETDLREWIATELGDAAVPRTVQWVDALPMLGNGKVDRRALVEGWDGDTA